MVGGTLAPETAYLNLPCDESGIVGENKMKIWYLVETDKHLHVFILGVDHFVCTKTQTEENEL